MNLGDELMAKQQQNVKKISMYTSISGGMAIKIGLQRMLDKLRARPRKLKVGRVEVNELMRGSTDIKIIEMYEKDIKQFNQECKLYGIQYTIAKKSLGKYEILYKGEDIERVGKAITNVIETAKKQQLTTREKLQDHVIKASELSKVKDCISKIKNKTLSR